MPERRSLKYIPVVCVGISKTGMGPIKDFDDLNIICFKIPASGKLKERKIQNFIRMAEERTSNLFIEITAPDCHLVISIERGLFNLCANNDEIIRRAIMAQLSDLFGWQSFIDTVIIGVIYCVVFLILIPDFFFILSKIVNAILYLF